MKNFITTIALAWFALGGQVIAVKPGDAIPNHYIIQHHPDISADDVKKIETLLRAPANRHATFKPKGILKKYDIGGFKGYHVELDPSAVPALQKSNLIKQIQPDAVVSISSPITLPSPLPMHVTKRDDGSVPANIRRIPTYTWGQSRLSHRRPKEPDFVYEAGGSTAYVIDTGIRTTHVEFATNHSSASRAVWGMNFIDGSPNTDENGHGTHCAGTIGGSTKGIAPLTELVAVKVFDAQGNGPWSGVLAGLSWVVEHARTNGRVGRAVVNMSLGGGRWSVIEEAVTAAVNAGVAVVVAAGNAGQPVNTTSPAACPDAITVGAIDGSDLRCYWSNYGVGLDFFAPGADIDSAWCGSDSDYRMESGTSMAAPHVAGLVAYLMQQYGPHTPLQMREKLNSFATMNMVQDAKDSSNAIVYNGNGAYLSEAGA
ncbi:peptidase S8/S53 domain-containing protein [Coniochaeta sp. 2T2.1]|nr:peptidase S8/S53 domain-containing protein [Coniochaeta sp. 2T2.1]